MALDKQIVPIVLRGGLAGKTDAKSVVPGRLLTLENAARNLDGLYQKRFGYSALAKASSGAFTTLQNVLALATFNNDLIATTDSKLYSWSPAAQTWFEKSNITSVSTTSVPVLRNSFEQSQVDVATNQGVQVTAYKDSRGGVWAVVSDSTTGAFILTETQLNSSGDKPTVRACGNYLYVYYVVGNTLRCRRLNPLNAVAFDSEVTLVSNVNGTNSHYDVGVYNGAMIVAYNNTTPAVSLFYVTQVPAVGSPVSGFPSQITLTDSADGCLTLVVGASYLYLAFYESGGGLLTYWRNFDFTAAFGPYTVGSVSPSVSNVTGAYDATSGKAYFFYEAFNATAINTYLNVFWLSTPGTVGGLTTSLIRSVGLASKAFIYNAQAYVAAVYDSTLQGTAFLLRWDGFINAKFNAGTAGGLNTARHLPQVLATSNAAAFTIPNLVKSQIISENNKIFTVRGIGACTVDFGADSTFQNAQLGGNLHFATGIMQAYDGFSAVEHGFHVFPESVTAAVQAGGSIPVGTRSYKVVYEWIDNQGQIHRSAPSVAVQATTTTGNQQVQLTIPTLRLTARRGVRTNATIGVYGTTSSPAGTVYYKLTSQTSPLYNDPTVDTVTYTDTAADTAITSNELLYTTGGIVENIAPPSCRIVTVFKNRLIIAGLETSNTFWMSKPFTPGEAVAFSDFLEFQLDAIGGDCTALGVLDDKLILFKRATLYYLSGDGPDNTVTQSNLNGPIAVQTDVGCPYPNSVVSTPRGLMFKSLKGIYLLDSSLVPQYVGADVEPYNGLTIESAVLLEGVNEVRFSTKEGTILVYNYFFNEWFVHTNLASFDAVNWQGVYTLLRTTSTVWTESIGFTDAGQHIPLRIGSSWISAAGIQGFQRIYRLLGIGNYKTPHKLRISLAYDFEPFFAEVKYLDTETAQQVSANTYGTQTPYGTGTYGGSGSGVYQFRAHLGRQKCQSFMFQIEDVPNSNPDEAYSFTGFALEIGIKRGGYKLPATKSV